jgi:hypothetical protein
MKRFIIFFTCMFFSLTILAQNRNVIWVHGIEENETDRSNGFWQEYAAQFAQQRRINSSNLDYNSAAGMRNMAREIVNRTNGNANNIGIGHSMGGLALREIDARTAPNHVGGIITMGSSLNGARIINAWQNGEVSAYISHSVNELLKGPKRQFYATYIIVNTSLRAFNGRNLAEVILDAALDNVPLGLLEGPSPTDLREGSAYLNNARMYSTNRPKISVYGNENRPVHYRLASSAIGQPDVFLPNVIRDARGVYNAFYIQNLATSYNILNAYRAAGWKAGRDYLDEKSETGWNNLIGATRTESKRSCYTEFVCPDYSCYDNINSYEDYLACQARCYQERCQTTTVRYNQSSDGLLHESTQTGQNTHATRSMWAPNRVFEARGVNHNEFDDHEESNRILNDIFNGAAGVPRFFLTDRR